MEKHLTPAQVCELVPGMTEKGLAQLRFLRRGPAYLKPSPRKVVYRLSDVERWLEEVRVATDARVGAA